METIYIAYKSCKLPFLVSVCSSPDVDLVSNIEGRCESGRENVSVCTDGDAIMSGGSEDFLLTQGIPSPPAPEQQSLDD